MNKLGYSFFLLASQLNSVDAGNDHDDTEMSVSGEKPWGKAIGAALLINLVTFVGVFFLTGEFVASHFFKKDLASSPRYRVFVTNIVPSFACGALFATSVYLILPEALHLISSHFSGGHDDHHRFLEEEEGHSEGAGIWRFGTSLIGGFLLPIVTSSFFPRALEDNNDAISKLSPVTGTDTDRFACAAGNCDVCEEDMKDNQADIPQAATIAPIVSTVDDKIILPKGPIQWDKAMALLFGDFFHNFGDGIFVGTAFLLCSKKVAFTITASTIYHELPQEVADFFLLTELCNMSPVQALALNFLSGLSVLMGACTILALEDMTNVAIGTILAVSGGIHLYIAIAEVFPRVKEAHISWPTKFISFISFVSGVVPIGLVLLNHNHC